MAVKSVIDVRALARLAVEKGASIKPYVVSWDISGTCSNPKRIEHYGRPPKPRRGKYVVVDEFPAWFHGGANEVGGKPMWVDMDVPCRQCPNCLRYRARQWANRAKIEVAASSRTWFGTMTLTPDAHDRVRLVCTQRLSGQGTTWEKLSQEEQFRLRIDAMKTALTLWLKRIRKESGARLRYILVAESHKSGLPHFHILIHEGDVPVLKRHLEGQWKLGFSKFKLIDRDPKVVWYVCKYLSKSALSRVRASVRYGNATSVIAPINVARDQNRPTTTDLILKDQEEIEKD